MKKAKVFIIFDDPKTQMVYNVRIKKIAKKYRFDVEYVTNNILNSGKNGKCKNSNCKCHRKQHKY